MNLTIYIDILFLLNLISDYIILSTTALITGERIKQYRILTAACIGALYNVIIFFPQLRLFNIIVFKILISFIILLISFKFKNICKFLKNLFTYYLVNALYGGGIYVFYSFTAIGSKMNLSNGVYYINLPLWAVILLTFFFYFLTKIFLKISEERLTQKQISNIEIHFNNCQITVQALFDTGNSLYDPISLLPVILIESNTLKGKFRSDIFHEIEQNKSCSLTKIHKAYPNLKFRVIPFKDVTGKATCIFAFKPSKVYHPENKTEIANVLIGIINTQLSNDNSYNALLHSKN